MSDKTVYVGIEAGLNEAIEYLESGNVVGVRKSKRWKRTFREPKAFSPDDIKNIRQKMNLSQPSFASLFGLSADAIRSWEQGRVAISGGNARLLELLSADKMDILEIFETKKDQPSTRA